VLGTVTWATAASVTASRPGDTDAIAGEALATGVSHGIAAAAGLIVLSLFIAVATMRRGEMVAQPRTSGGSGQKAGHSIGS